MTTGWKTKSLGELVLDTKTINPILKPDHVFEYIDVSSVSNRTFSIEGTQRLKGKDAPSRARRLVHTGDVIFATIRPTLKRIAVVPPELNAQVCSTGYIVLRPGPELDSRFLFYALFTERFERAMRVLQKGASYPAVTDAEVRSQPIDFPPIAEQRRIVAILEEAFDAIGIATANINTNIQNARELLASEAYALLGRKENWEPIQLSELLERGWILGHLDGNHGSDYPRKEEFVDTGVPYIAASAIKNGEVDFDEAKYLSPERAASIRKGIAQNRDVLFAHNATVGPVAVLKTDEAAVILGTSLTYYRCDPRFIHPEYLAHFMLSPAFTSQYRQVMKQSTRNQVPITKQREFFHVIPPIDIQVKIANSLGELSAQTERLIEIGMQKVVALEELKRSLISRAFSGGLPSSKAVKEMEAVA